jgi:hypothetical protein
MCVVCRKGEDLLVWIRLLVVLRVEGGTSTCERYVFLEVKCWEAESCLEAERTRRRRCTLTPLVEILRMVAASMSVLIQDVL